LFQRAQERSVFHSNPESDKFVLSPQGFQHPLLIRTQHFHRQGLEVAEYPEQIQPLQRRRPQITRTDWSHDSQNTGRELFKPHGARSQIFIGLIAESWCNSKSTDYCTSADAMEEIFHIFPTFFAWNPLLFHRILQDCT
jgi:hypothetical protein